MICIHLRSRAYKHTHIHSLPTQLFSTSYTNFWFCKFSSKSHFLPFISSKNEPSARALHAKVIKSGTLHISKVANYIMSLYVKARDLKNVYKLFDEMPYRDVRSWTIVISGCARLGYSRMGLDCFRNMLSYDAFPNRFTLSSVLKCCSGVGDVSLGREVHGWILTSGVGLDVVLNNSVLDAYVKCRAFEDVERLLGTMAERDSVSWNILIGACLEIGDVQSSMDLFGIMPFKDVASWNTMIDGMMRSGFERDALELLHQMAKSGPPFNDITFSVALALASFLVNVDLGRQIHGRMIVVGLEDNQIIRSSLIDMYSKCGELGQATMIFESVSHALESSKYSKSPYDNVMRHDISWSSMVSGFVRNNKYEDALKTFCAMVYKQVEMDKFTLTSIVSTCANVGILELGQQVHGYVQKIGHELDVHLSSALIDMYAKSGSLKDAQLIFKEINDRNVVLWTSMISGCALYGQASEAIQLFECMVNEGILPNKVTFLGLLTACSYAGQVKKGCRYFKLMKEVYGIKPGVEHFTCMVDLYGRAGLLNKAKEFIYENGISHLTEVWKSLLSSCRLYKNIELGKWVSERLLELEPYDSGHYVLLSNMCATDNRWEEASKVRSLMQQRGVKKYPGQSWIKINDQVHTFVIGDRSHPRQIEIYSYLDKLIGRLKEIGYSPDANFVMQDVEEEQGEVLLGFHSEKLAIAYGIMNTASGVPIRVMKNLRVCDDCHNFFKYTSQLLEREIIMRDIHRFHHFKNGQCSCGDYW